ncbi:VOC family protein [Streptomyces sp. HK10]|uniref:VOC family protein n=1 Tax=Streptomyces sp. HK10 TaxID=3373255 RepID=UPI003748B8E0
MPVPRRPADPERWFRTRPDSSELERPRLLARSLIDVAELDEDISHYERLLGTPADLRMPIPDFGGLELAAVGGLLLIASARAFTPVQRQTAYSLIVPSLEAQLDLLEGTGTAVLEPPEPILPGARARVRYPDGALAELVEHRPWDGERPRPAAFGAARTDLPATGIRLLARRAVEDADFLDTVRLYETLLQVPAVARPRLTGPFPARTAIVGNLLLVGLPAPVPHGAPQPRAALIVPATQGHTPEAAVLAGGLTAEVWSEHPAGAPRAPRPAQARTGAGHG